MLRQWYIVWKLTSENGSDENSRVVRDEKINGDFSSPPFLRIESLHEK